MQNAAAHLVTAARRCVHMTPVLRACTGYWFDSGSHLRPWFWHTSVSRAWLCSIYSPTAGWRQRIPVAVICALHSLQSTVGSTSKNKIRRPQFHRSRSSSLEQSAGWIASSRHCYWNMQKETKEVSVWHAIELLAHLWHRLIANLRSVNVLNNNNNNYIIKTVRPITITVITAVFSSELQPQTVEFRLADSSTAAVRLPLPYINPGHTTATGTLRCCGDRVNYWQSNQLISSLIKLSLIVRPQHYSIKKHLIKKQYSLLL